MIFNSFFNYTFICKKLVSELRRFGTTADVDESTTTFTANVISGKAPLSVKFTSTTTGNPTDYYWVFEPSTSSDWNSHHVVSAVHTFKKPGKYTV